MRTMTPLERRVLSTLDSAVQRWWSIVELCEELAEDPYMSIVGALRDLRRADYVNRHVAAAGDRYAITTIGASALTRRVA